ncbi:hypothetical protein C0J52_14933 [Blattella germanica]|nr:hypothetical protein C0J52_14933 [Blattella germanica]
MNIAGCYQISEGFIKDKVYRSPMPANLAQLRHRITAIVQEVTPDMLQGVWQEIDFWWDVGCI